MGGWAKVGSHVYPTLPRQLVPVTVPHCRYFKPVDMQAFIAFGIGHDG
jgi:hypothetical protein